ncbi:50S ribosomal protein L25 [Leptothoe sp. LEGE 181152]|nr:50S ribosomal protein L25 [Leptothoe sp. LEGE 181152]
MELTLDCSKRADNEKPGALRRAGVMPAVLYGHDGTNSVSLKANTREVEALIRNAKGQKVELSLNVIDMPWNGKVVLQEVQNHPWKSEIYHISFLAQ